jgi:hypothetical protein
VGIHKGKYKLSKLSCDHTHSIHAEDYAHYPVNRKLSKAEEQDILGKLKVGGKAAKIVLEAEKTINKKITSKQVQNVRTKHKLDGTKLESLKKSH